MKITPVGFISILLAVASIVAFGIGLKAVDTSLDPQQYKIIVASFMFMVFGLSGWLGLELFALFFTPHPKDHLSPGWQKLIRDSGWIKASVILAFSFFVSLFIHWVVGVEW